MAEDRDDTLARAWGPITVRVAAILAAYGEGRDRDTLYDVREHVLWHMPDDLPVHRMEDRAEYWTRSWIARMREEPLAPDFWQDVDHPLPVHWRDALFAQPSARAKMVLWHHYADGRALEELTAAVEQPLAPLEAARDGLREKLRRVAGEDGEKLDGWSDRRLDALLHRLAQVPRGPSRSLLDVVDGQVGDVLDQCVRCTRARRLVNDGSLLRSDLVPPIEHIRPTSTVPVVALSCAPGGEPGIALIKASCKSQGYRLPYGLLLHAPKPDSLFETLCMAAEIGEPERSFVRGVYREVPGRWSEKNGPIGPVLEQAAEIASKARWGTIEGLGELPPHLPPPKSSWPIWSVAAVLLCVAVLGLRAITQPEPTRALYPLTLTAVPTALGLWLDFDVDESGQVAIVGARSDEPVLVLDGRSSAQKLQISPGDGHYRVRVEGQRALVASVTPQTRHLPEIVRAASSSPDPLRDIATAIRAMDPSADVRIVP